MPMHRIVVDLPLACPVEVHDELRSDPHRVRTETVAVGATTYKGEVLNYLRNCKICAGTLAFEVDVDDATTDGQPDVHLR